jgi:hypothetical protein
MMVEGASRHDELTIVTLYSDETFQNQNFVNHHEGRSPLSELKLGLVSQVPLDYMHLVCLGIMKKLLLIWSSGPLTCRLGPKQVLELSRRLISCKSYLGRDFNRKCRSLKDLKHWKATEYRTFLLYLGPVVLKGILSTNMYSHFMLFHTAIYILLSYTDKAWVTYAGSLLNRFVGEASFVYFREIMVYNMHGLLHLHEDALNLGSLELYSAFEFENSMQYLKKLIRMNRSHLSQVVKRVKERSNFDLDVNHRIYNSKYSAKNGDNCVILNDSKVCLITKVLPNDKFECSVFKARQVVSHYPCCSEKLNILFVSRPRSNRVIELENIFKKCLLIPSGETFFCIPLIHS